MSILSIIKNCGLSRSDTTNYLSRASKISREFTYKTPVNDFALAQIRVEPEQHTDVNLQSAGILLVMQGELKNTRKINRTYLETR